MTFKKLLKEYFQSYRIYGKQKLKDLKYKEESEKERNI